MSGMVCFQGEPSGASAGMIGTLEQRDRSKRENKEQLWSVALQHKGSLCSQNRHQTTVAIYPLVYL
jgi:hypothetical protein